MGHIFEEAVSSGGKREVARGDEAKRGRESGERRTTTTAAKKKEEWKARTETALGIMAGQQDRCSDTSGGRG